MRTKLLKIFVRMSKYALYGIILQSSLCCFGISYDSEAQVKRLNEISIDVNFVNSNLESVFSEIEEKTNFTFAYLEKKLPKEKLTLKSADISLENLLLEISKNSGLAFRRMSSTIHVKDGKRNDPAILEVIQASVSGKITDDDGEPLPGATIIEKGTSNGTVTDVDGNYRIEVAEDATLLVSFIGYDSKEVSVNSQSTINVTLSISTESLEEVVVIGYGTQKKKDVTGAISSVKGDVISEVPVASVEQTLSGRMSGVQVINGSGAPGSGATIRVRGVGTLNNNEPLYVIDGIILGNVKGGGLDDVSPLSMINPNDIESIDVLKDASATAIYGARAGNGVVIITTKRGVGAKLSINYETYAGVNILDPSKYNRLSGPEWAQITARTNELNGNTVYTGQPLVEAVLAGEDFPQHDWVDALTRNGSIKSHNLSVTGGSESSNYYSSLSYFDQLGTIYGSDLTRYTMRFNSDHKIGNRFKMGNTMLLSRSISNRQSNVNPSDNSNDYIKRVVGINPYKPIYADDGSYAGVDSHPAEAEGILDQANQHSIWAAKENTDIYKINRIWASVYLDFEIMEGLTFHTMGSIDFNSSKREDRNDFNDIEGTQLVLPENTSLLFRNDENRTLFWENTLTYDKSFGDHKITALAGLQFQNTLNTWFSARDGAFENTDYWFFDRPKVPNEADPSIPLVIPGVDNSQVEQGVNSFFGRIFYEYKGKYLVTATVRRDGSSKFGLDRRWGTFPAISGAWRISEEDFMPDLPWLSNLKIRAGYGISGSDNADNYQYAASVGQGGAFDYSFNGGLVPGATINRLANPLLRWEEIRMANVAFDAGFFDNRLNVAADFYDKLTSDLFLPFAPALELGNETTPEGNLGEISNKGIDLTINTVNMRGAFTWTTDLVFGTVKNEILKLPGNNADRFTSDGWQQNEHNISRVGEEVGAIYGYVLNGIFQTWDEVYAHAYQDQALIEFDTDGNPVYDVNARDDVTRRTSTAPGDFRFADLNGDGFIDSEGDRTIIGSVIPDFTIGFTNTFSYKGILLSVLFQGVQGINVYNTLKGDYTTRERLDAWDGEGSSTTEPRLAGNGNGRTSAYRVEDADFIRLKNLRLAYSFPQDLISKVGLKNFQLYVTGTNLFTITKYTGYDPEVGLREAGDNETAGIDRGRYPLTRQFTAGLKVSF